MKAAMMSIASTIAVTAKPTLADTTTDSAWSVGVLVFVGEEFTNIIFHMLGVRR